MTDFIQEYENQSAVPAETGTINNMMVSRQAQEVQAAMVIAKRFPRDQVVAFNKVMDACKRVSLATQAEYTYPRGGTKVNGPSIRLAEAIAQNWGNMDCGVIELDNNDGASEMMAYAWDLETNTRVTKTFSVKHQRDTKKGSKTLTDGRDIYEATANFGARRLRACILSVIPGDVVDAAVDACRKTMTGNYKEPLIDRMRKMVTVFEDEHMISKEQIEESFGYKLESFGEDDYLRIRGIYKSVRDGMSKLEDYFKIKKKREGKKPASSLDKATPEEKKEKPVTEPESVDKELQEEMDGVFSE